MLSDARRGLSLRAGVRRSQNGFDNSGVASNITWEPDGKHFAHWPIRSAGWLGVFDPTTFTYQSISWDRLRSTVSLLQQIALNLSGHPAVLGIEALNEPWQFTPLDVLKAFYWDAYWAVRAAAPHWCALEGVPNRNPSPTTPRPSAQDLRLVDHRPHGAGP